MLKFCKYQGTGNDFILIDNRNSFFDKINSSIITKLCHRRFGIGADGLILLNNSDKYDFEMIYYNPDASAGSMCGNGGRCMVAYARSLGIIDAKTLFLAADGLHHAYIKDYNAVDESAIVSLEMNDVDNINQNNNYIYMNTGAPHYVLFRENIDSINIIEEGRRVRYSADYKDQGTNVDFAEKKNGSMYVRTYEKGVEDETLSCGTGVTAVAIASRLSGLLNDKNECNIITKGGNLKVSFEQHVHGFTNIYLEGAAQLVFRGEINAEV